MTKEQSGIIWELLNLYHDDSCSIDTPPIYNLSLENIYDLAAFIPQTHTNYPQAQDLCVDILMRFEFDAHTKDELLQQKFTHAMKGTRQYLTDNLFHDLCGKKVSDNKQIDIKGETATLLGLAKSIESLHEQLAGNDTPRFFSRKRLRDDEAHVSPHQSPQH